jgi:membrane-associated phospholipid phosphatase
VDKRHPLVRLTVALVLAAVLSGSALLVAGFRPLIPTGFALSLLLILLPLGWVASGVFRLIEPVTHGARTRIVVAVAFTAGYIALYHAPKIVELFVWIFGLVLARPRRPSRALLVALVAVVAGYSALWSLNYIALWLVRSRMADATLRTVDIGVYSMLAGRPIHYAAWFPLVSSRPLLAILDAAYLLFFVELGVMLFLLADDAHRLATYLLRLFSAYGIALLVFIAWPVAGPYLVFPDTIRPFAGTSYGIMQQGQIEFASILAGAQPITAAGYFVGLPSLHTAAAVLFQCTLRPYRAAFWSFLPLNVLMAVSTIVLGFHYIGDAVAGLALGCAAVGLIRFGTAAVERAASASSSVPALREL